MVLLSTWHGKASLKYTEVSENCFTGRAYLNAGVTLVENKIIRQTSVMYRMKV